MTDWTCRETQLWNAR